MKWHLRGFCLFSDFPKAVLMYHRQKCCLWRLCRRKTSTWAKCQDNIETSLKHFFLYVPFSPPVINHIYHLWTVYNSSLSCSSIRGETCWGKLTQLNLYQIEIPQSIHFQEHHHYFIFPGKWTAQFCLITSCALMHYKRRNAFTTFRVVVRRWDKPDQYS